MYKSITVEMSEGRVRIKAQTGTAV